MRRHLSLLLQKAQSPAAGVGPAHQGASGQKKKRASGFTRGVLTTGAMALLTLVAVGGYTAITGGVGPMAALAAAVPVAAAVGAVTAGTIVTRRVVLDRLPPLVRGIAVPMIVGGAAFLAAGAAVLLAGGLTVGAVMAGGLAAFTASGVVAAVLFIKPAAQFAGTGYKPGLVVGGALATTLGLSSVMAGFHSTLEVETNPDDGKSIYPDPVLPQGANPKGVSPQANAAFRDLRTEGPTPQITLTRKAAQPRV